MFTSNCRASLSNANLPDEKALYPVSVRQLTSSFCASFGFAVTCNTLASNFQFPLAGLFGTCTLWNCGMHGAQRKRQKNFSFAFGFSFKYFLPILVTKQSCELKLCKTQLIFVLQSCKLCSLPVGAGVGDFKVGAHAI
jgi:hypothetical protein